jgi:hypothetical protein
MDLVPTDSKDNHIVSTALEGAAGTIVTEDARDLLALKGHQDLRLSSRSSRRRQGIRPAIAAAATRLRKELPLPDGIGASTSASESWKFSAINLYESADVSSSRDAVALRSGRRIDWKSGIDIRTVYRKRVGLAMPAF